MNVDNITRLGVAGLCLISGSMFYKTFINPEIETLKTGAVEERVEERELGGLENQIREDTIKEIEREDKRRWEIEIPDNSSDTGEFGGGGKEDDYEEYPDPEYNQDDNFSQDSETMLLARLIYGESRGQIELNPDYVYGSIRTVITRAEKRGKPIRDFILQRRKKRIKKDGKEKVIDVYAYTCFDPDDTNYEKLKDPLNKGDSPTEEERKEIWEKCYRLAEKALKGDLEGRADLREVTNYFVGGDPRENRTRKEAAKNRIPSWAYKMKNGRFILEDGKRVPREPEAIVDLEGGRNAYFYNFEYF
jgi:hypothetical protein